MSTENKAMPPNCPGGLGRGHRRGAVMLALLPAMTFGMAVLPWVLYQLDCFHREQRAKRVLEAEIYPGAIGLTSLAALSGPTVRDAPFLTLFELPRGRLYVPIVRADVGGGGWPHKAQELNQGAWNQLRSFRYLQWLRVIWCSPEPDLKADFSGFQHLTTVIIDETPFSARDIRTLARLPELQDAVFKKKQGIDEWLPCIAELRHLRTLEIEGDVSDEGAALLASLETLETLSLESDRLTSNVVPALAKLPNLKALSVACPQIDDEWLRRLAALKGLKGLTLVGSNAVSDKGVGYLAALETLEALHLNSNRITSKSAPALARMKQLKHLALPNTRIDDEGFRRLTDLEELTVLELKGTAISDVGGELRFPKLGYLGLADTNLTDVGLRHISHSAQLRCLVITGTHVTNASIEPLAAMPSLVAVYASRTGVAEGSKEWLRLMNTLLRRRADEGDLGAKYGEDKRDWSIF